MEEEFEEIVSNLEDFHLVEVDMTETPSAYDCTVSVGEARYEEEWCEAHKETHPAKTEKIISFQFMCEGVDLEGLPIVLPLIVSVDSPLGVALVSGSLTERVQERLKDFG